MTPHTEQATHDLGPLVSRHGRSRTAIVPLMSAIVVLLCSAVIPLALMSGAHVDPARLPLLIGVSAGMVVVGLLMLLGWKLTALKTELALHEHGVAVYRSGTAHAESMPFVDMADVYLFRTGGYAGGIVNALAFRRSLQDPWVDVLDNRRHAFALRAAIVEGQVVARLPVALTAIDAGNTVRFHAIDRSTRLTKRLFGGMLMVDAHAVDLGATGIDVQGTSIPLERIHRIEGVGSDGQVRLLDAQGKLVHAFDYLCLFSADLFLAVLAELIHRRTPAYRGLMAH